MCLNAVEGNKTEVLQPHVSGRKWILTTEGAAFQPEGLWPEGWNAAPEVVNDTYAL